MAYASLELFYPENLYGEREVWCTKRGRPSCRPAWRYVPTSDRTKEAVHGDLWTHDVLSSIGRRWL